MTLNEGQGPLSASTLKSFSHVSFLAILVEFGWVISEKGLAYMVTVTLKEGQGHLFLQTWKGLT